jgi:hypothetical protein
MHFDHGAHHASLAAAELCSILAEKDLRGRMLMEHE